MPNPCYPSCPPPVHTILNHAPPLVHHLAFTGYNANEGILVGAIVLISGLLFLIADRMLRRK